MILIMCQNWGQILVGVGEGSDLFPFSGALSLGRGVSNPFKWDCFESKDTLCRWLLGLCMQNKRCISLLYM